MQIRPTIPADTPVLLELTRETGVFRPEEIIALREVLDDFHAGNQTERHVCVTGEEAGRIVGYAYYAPASMTDGTWYLFWIAVAPGTQGRGYGSRLLLHAEQEARDKQARQMLIETSSLPAYAMTQRFYEKHDYTVVAVLPDYYRVGDDMVVYRKQLTFPDR